MVKDELGISLDKADDSILGTAAKVGPFLIWLSSLCVCCAVERKAGDSTVWARPPRSGVVWLLLHSRMR